MAPKERPAAKPGSKSAIPEKLTDQQMKILSACVTLAVVSVIIIVIMTILNVMQQEIGSYIDYPLEKLRDTLIIASGDPEYKIRGAMAIAAAVVSMPKDIDDAEHEYQAKKKIYQDLFHKAMRSSYGPWKLRGKSLYYFVNGEKNWYDAENFCVSRDAHLASVLDNEEQNFITSQVKKPSWIGLMDENKKGVWGWTDGSVLLNQYWSVGESNNTQCARESDCDCALIVPSSTIRNWKDDNCHKLYGWVCKQNLEYE